MEDLQLSICILNWNGGEFLNDCISSIINSEVAISHEVLVVDNDSHDGSAEQIARMYPQVRLLKRSDNTGFATGNNAGIKISRGKYILLLNPDTLVLKDSLEKMVDFLDNQDDAGVCGPRLCHPESGLVESSARAFPRLIPLFWNLSYVDRLFPRSRFFSAYQRTWSQNCEPHEVDWVTGACLMIRKDVIRKIGLLDENIFMYCEDIDWCMRGSKAGWNTYYLPGVTINHYKGLSSRQRQKNPTSALGVWGAQQYTRSVIYFYSKHYGRLKTFLLRLVLVGTSLLKSFLWVIKGVVSLQISSSLRRARSYLSMIPVALTKIN